MKLISTFYVGLCCLLMLAFANRLHAQNSRQAPQQVDAAQVEKLAAGVEANMNDLTLHQQYIKAVGIKSPELLAQYNKWMEQFPQSATVPYAIGSALAGSESPKARPYLLKAVAIDPKLAKAFQDLWIDAERWGDFEGGREYLKKAVDADPASADYAFYYANSFSKTDEKKYKALSLNVAKKFAGTERGAQSLYWLANRSNDTKEKTTYYEQMRSEFPPDKFSWSSSGMSEYFDVLLQVAPGKAITLAETMGALKGKYSQAEVWTKNVQVAKNVSEARKLLEQKKPYEARLLLDKTSVSKWSSAKEVLALLKAEATDASGNTSSAYDSLLSYYSKEPIKKIRKALGVYASKLGKSEEQLTADIWKNRDVASKPATPFTLKKYFEPGSTSLSDLQGKVVLITYWFPGCGPCRGEFPHFENVVKKFKGKSVEYIGINILPDQNEYVIPFMKSSGYSFTPLEDYDTRNKGNLDNRNAAPVNFLIDQKGNVVFANFRINEKNEDMLESMISSMLDHKKS